MLRNMLEIVYDDIFYFDLFVSMTSDKWFWCLWLNMLNDDLIIHRIKISLEYFVVVHSNFWFWTYYRLSFSFLYKGLDCNSYPIDKSYKFFSCMSNVWRMVEWKKFRSVLLWWLKIFLRACDEKSSKKWSLEVRKVSYSKAIILY